MTNLPKAIVLGGTSPHIALIKNLRQRGYYTVLLDYYRDPPAKEFANEHLQESTLDTAKVLEISKKLDAKLVISTCIDQANATACYVAEKLGLPAPYSYETALNVTNKGLMKRKMVESGIPTARYTFISDLAEFKNSGLTFPVVVKPADSNGSAGVRKANDFSKLESYLAQALMISRTRKAIVEEFKDGIEVSIDCFIKNKIAHLIMIRQKFKMNGDSDSVLQSPGSMAPATISKRAEDQVIDIANKIALNFDLNNTPLLIQAFIKGDDVSIIEFAPRVGGGLSFRTVKLITGFDILDAAVDSYLGVDTDVHIDKANVFYSTNIIYAKPGTFDHVTGIEALLEDKVIEEFHYYKTKGMEIGGDLSTRSRIGAFLVKANDKESLFNKMKTSIDRLEVYDTTGRAIMRKDLFSEKPF